MTMESGVAQQPILDLGGFVGAVVVENEVDFQGGQDLRVDMAQKGDKLLASVRVCPDFCVSGAEGIAFSGLSDPRPVGYPEIPVSTVAASDGRTN